MLLITKTILLGFLAISAIFSLVNGSYQLSQKLSLPGTIIVFGAVLAISYFTGKLLL
jgi:hypothetical protein